MNPLKAIPNLLTLLNLTCGVLGILSVLEGDLEGGCHFIWIAVAFDFMDGFAARLLKAQSPIGKQLDSLADLVSFGVLPGFIFFKIFMQTGIDSDVLLFSFILVPALSALRLAKFNIDENQTDEFIGLSTTAHAIFVSAIVLAWSKDPQINDFFQEPLMWFAIMSIGSLLLVSPIRLLALKFKSFSLQDNWMRYILLSVSLLLIILFKEAGLALAIIAYIVFSLLFNLKRNKIQ